MQPLSNPIKEVSKYPNLPPSPQSEAKVRQLRSELQAAQETQQELSAAEAPRFFSLSISMLWDFYLGFMTLRLHSAFIMYMYCVAQHMARHRIALHVYVHTVHACLLPCLPRSTCLPVSLPTCLPRLPTYLPIHLPTCRPAYLPARLPTYPPPPACLLPYLPRSTWPILPYRPTPPSHIPTYPPTYLPTYLPI